MLKFFINGAIIQILTLVLQSLLFNCALGCPSNGTGGIWFAMLFKYCYYNPHSQIKLCCLNCKFSKRVYPYVLLGVSIVLSLRIPLEMVVGLLYGLFQVNVEKWITFPSDWLAKIARLIKVDFVDCWIK
jgi:membrane associated rhomboid family serine protease